MNGLVGQPASQTTPDSRMENLCKVQFGSSASFLTDRFLVLELQNPPIVVSKLNKKCVDRRFSRLKIWERVCLVLRFFCVLLHKWLTLSRLLQTSAALACLLAAAAAAAVAAVAAVAAATAAPALKHGKKGRSIIFLDA